uniref:Uncharacterized protein n=1 Tax=Anguilla anguilla TaxID=7936 RepID=A0A0E9T5K6_ANGAN
MLNFPQHITAARLQQDLHELPYFRVNASASPSIHCTRSPLRTCA